MRFQLIIPLAIALAVGASAQAATIDLKVAPAPARELPQNLLITDQTPLDSYESQFRAILAQDETRAPVWHKLGTVLFHNGKQDEAIKAWDRAAALDALYTPAEVMKDVQTVFLLQRTGKPEAAREQLTLTEARHAENAYFQLIMAEQAMRSRNEKGAMAAYSKAVALAPDLFATHLNLGRYYEFKDMQAKAREAYVEATRVAPDHAMPWDFLGSHQFSQGSSTEALASFRRAEAANPAQPLAELRLANLYAQIGDQIGAREWYGRALERAVSGQNAIRVSLSDAQLRLGLLDEARATIDKVLETERSAPMLVARGYIDEQEGDLNTAIERYREAVRLDPGNVVASNNLSMALVKADMNPQEALVHAQYALEKQPRNSAIFGTHALSLAHAGKTEEARIALATALRLAPDDPWIRYHYGKILNDAGETEEARLHLEAVLILKPSFPMQSQIREMLDDKQAN